MRRHRNTSKRPPKALAHKAPRLDTNGLATAYDWLMADRTLGMKMAVEWYSTNIPALLYAKQLDADSQKTFDRAAKAKALGDSSTNPGEKQQAWRTALRTWERIFPDAPLNKVDDAEKKAEDGGQPSKSVAAVKTVLEHLNNAFKKSSMTFQPTMESERQLSEGVIWIPQTELAALTAAAPLKIALNEAVTVTKVRSLVTVDGETNMDGAKFMELLPIVLEDVSEWAVTLNGRALTSSVRRGKVPTAPVTPTSGTPRAPRSIKVRICPNDGCVIRLIKSDGGKYKGLNAQRFAAIKDGMTVREFKAACVAKIGPKRCSNAYHADFLSRVVDSKFVAIT